MEVRAASDDDRREVAALWTERWGSRRVVSRGRMHEPLDYPMLVVSGPDGHIAGALTYDVRAGELEAVTVDAFVRGAGVGRALIEAAAAEGRQLGCRRLWLMTTNDNTPALRFYQRCGMTLAALHRGAIAESRRLKPEIPETGLDGIPIRDELEFELRLDGGATELDEFRQAGRALTDGVADYLAAVPSRPVWQPPPEVLRELLLGLPLPEDAAALDELVATMLRDVLPHAMGNGHPAFFGWVNPPPSPAGVAASLAAAAMNPSVVAGEHADVYLERAVVRWLAELVGFPHEPGAGLLTSGASVATIICLAGARGRALAAAGHDVRADGLRGAPRLVAYVPSEAHSCVRRALELLGVGSGSMRDVPLDGGRLDAAALRASIAADRAGGLVPALLVGSAGTVNTGAIDPLAELAELAAEERIWFHVDGAYGAFAVLDPSVAARFDGMARADSLTLDPHKWLGVPVDAGCALVRRGDDLRDAFSLIPPYLRQDADGEVGTFAEYGVEQTRPFRALKTWATIAARGRAGIAAQVQRANELARELAAMVETEPELELAAAPQTSIVAFRARPAGCPPTRLDDLNRALPEAVQARGRAFVTGTVFDGRETLRACILHPATRTEHLATLLREVVAAARALADGPRSSESP
jgi:aromatic-L-amino-acid/L-tryptophan decarboxylase